MIPDHTLLLSNRLLHIILDALKAEYEATYAADLEEVYDVMAVQVGYEPLHVRMDKEIQDMLMAWAARHQ